MAARNGISRAKPPESGRYLKRQARQTIDAYQEAGSETIKFSRRGCSVRRSGAQILDLPRCCSLTSKASRHHCKECSFETILKKHNLTTNPALVLVGKIVNGADTDNTLHSMLNPKGQVWKRLLKDLVLGRQRRPRTKCRLSSGITKDGYLLSLRNAWSASATRMGYSSCTASLPAVISRD